MGTGKTITAIAIAGALYRADRIARVLVTAPLSILGVWESEFHQFAAFDHSLTVLNGPTLDKKRDALRQLGGGGLQVAVINYESACGWKRNCWLGILTS